MNVVSIVLDHDTTIKKTCISDLAPTPKVASHFGKSSPASGQIIRNKYWAWGRQACIFHIVGGSRPIGLKCRRVPIWWNGALTNIIYIIYISCFYNFQACHVRMYRFYHPLIRKSSDWHRYLNKTRLLVQKLIKVLPYRLRVLLMCLFPYTGLAIILVIEPMVQ